MIIDLSNRKDYDGWAVQIAGSEPILDTFSRTREQARDKRRQMMPDLFRSTRVVKVTIKLQAKG